MKRTDGVNDSRYHRHASAPLGISLKTISPAPCNRPDLFPAVVIRRLAGGGAVAGILRHILLQQPSINAAEKPPNLRALPTCSFEAGEARTDPESLDP
jgi:hypothetical protein